VEKFSMLWVAYALMTIWCMILALALDLRNDAI